jgi:hypothetical protein
MASGTIWCGSMPAILPKKHGSDLHYLFLVSSVRDYPDQCCQVVVCTPNANKPNCTFTLFNGTGIHELVDPTNSGIVHRRHASKSQLAYD